MRHPVLRVPARIVRADLHTRQRLRGLSTIPSDGRTHEADPRIRETLLSTLPAGIEQRLQFSRRRAHYVTPR